MGKIDLGPGEIFSDGVCLGRTSGMAIFSVDEVKATPDLEVPKNISFEITFSVSINPKRIKAWRKVKRRYLNHVVRKAYRVSRKAKVSKPGNRPI